MAGAGPDIAVGLWDVATGQPTGALTHTGTIWSIAFSPDGATLATAGQTTVRLWDPATGAQFDTLTGHTSAIFSVAFSPDGATLASAGGDNFSRGDNQIRVWALTR